MNVLQMNRYAQNCKYPTSGLRPTRLIVVLLFAQLLGCAAQTDSAKPFVTGAAGTEIVYEMYGSGVVGLVFVHGWACDRSYWREQTSVFGEGYRVVAMDLGGHGDSSNERNDWSIESFGQDVAAVVAEIDVEHIVLIGHSMGGPVVLEAAARIGDRVIAVIGVDTLKNIASEPMAQEDAERAFNTTAEEFPMRTDAFVRNAFFTEESPSELVDEIAADMANGNPRVAAASGVSLMTYNVQAALDSIPGTPLVLINSDYSPTDGVALTAAHPNSAVSIVSGAGHFVMLEQPSAFNAVLISELDRVIHGK